MASAYNSHDMRTPYRNEFDDLGGLCLQYYGLLNCSRMSLPYAGNISLRAPEIRSAHPSPNCRVDYERADLWAAGTLAHEIYSGVNPFYNPQLSSAEYSKADLPELPTGVPIAMRSLVDTILDKRPEMVITCDRIA